MIIEIFSVKDAKVDAFLQPFFSPTKGAALRSLMDVLDQADHQFSKHALDYTLYSIGSFDDLTGEFSHPDIPQPIVNLADLKTSMNRNS